MKNTYYERNIIIKTNVTAIQQPFYGMYPTAPQSPGGAVDRQLDKCSIHTQQNVEEDNVWLKETKGHMKLVHNLHTWSLLMWIRHYAKPYQMTIHTD